MRRHRTKCSKRQIRFRFDSKIICSRQVRRHLRKKKCEGVMNYVETDQVGEGSATLTLLVRGASFMPPCRPPIWDPPLALLRSVVALAMVHVCVYQRSTVRDRMIPSIPNTTVEDTPTQGREERGNTNRSIGGQTLFGSMARSGKRTDPLPRKHMGARTLGSELATPGFRQSPTHPGKSIFMTLTNLGGGALSLGTALLTPMVLPSITCSSLRAASAAK